MTTRRKARIRSLSESDGCSHLDLENLVVSLLVSRGDAWPNALYSAGYRLHSFDAPVPLLETGPGGQTRPVRKAPDAVAHHQGRNAILVLECKTGTDVGMSQIPEGRTATADEWASALSLPRNALVPPCAHGLLIAEPDLLEPKVGEIDTNGASWLRVEPSGFRLDPDHQSDDRLRKIVADLPASPWPRSYVPFSHEPSSDGKARVIASIGPLILEAAGRGDPFITAQDIARTTHAAVWGVTSDKRQSGWVSAVETALTELATGPMRTFATYNLPLRRLHLQGVRSGQPATPRLMSAIRQAISTGQRRSQSRQSRVVSKRGQSAQIGLWEDEDF